MIKKVILISPFPPVQNPRLLKEYHTLKTKGFKVKIFYGVRDKWAVSYENQTNDFHLVGGSYGSFTYYFTKVIHKFLKPILPLELGFHRISLLLYFKILFAKADIYIAHNLAALPIAVIAAKMHNSKCGFDAEDFHRNEINDNQESYSYKISKILEDKYLTKVNYLTTASPLISIAYKQLYFNINPLVINNVFSKQFICSKEIALKNKPLSLFWFSQTIGKKRGIEQVIQALGILKNNHIQLSILGVINISDKKYFENLALENNLNLNQIHFLNPVEPNLVFNIAAMHDIGLALELNVPYNRDICLTNKLFTYIISGLAIIATETQAQKEFIQQYPNIGLSFPINDIEKLAKHIKFYQENRKKLIEAKMNSKKLAIIQLNWETESTKFIDIINKTLAG